MLCVDKREEALESKRNEAIQQTAENEQLLIDISNNSEIFLAVDSRGNSWFAKTLDNGKQAWTSVRNNKIQNGGINNTPRTFNDRSGLSGDEPPPQKGKKTLN